VANVARVHREFALLLTAIQNFYYNPTQQTAQQLLQTKALLVLLYIQRDKYNIKQINLKMVYHQFILMAAHRTKINYGLAIYKLLKI